MSAVGEQQPAADLEARVDDIAAHVAALTSELTDLASAVYAGDLSASTPATPSPRYATLDEWVGEYFAPTFGRLVGGEHRWCSQWQQHAEAITRLEALWRSWEALRLDPASRVPPSGVSPGPDGVPVHVEGVTA